MPVTVGVLALQGAFDLHLSTLRSLGARAVPVRTVEELAEVDGLILPGGESTTMSMLLASSGLDRPIIERIEGGMATFGTCAGMVLLATEVLDGRPDQHALGVLDVTVRRNGYGRQVASFEADIAVAGLDEPFPATFIRAPAVEAVGPGVEVLATLEGRPVLVRSQALPVTAASFHPELTNDTRLHRRLLEEM